MNLTHDIEDHLADEAHREKAWERAYDDALRNGDVLYAWFGEGALVKLWNLSSQLNQYRGNVLDFDRMQVIHDMIQVQRLACKQYADARFADYFKEP